jgi:hypothetical protein
VRYLLILLVLIISACNKNEVATKNNEPKNSSTFESISNKNYYPAEIFNEKYFNLYGTWKVIGTSGGFHGQGYKIDFDYLVLKPYGIFGVMLNDKFVNYGRLSIKIQKDKEFLATFIPEIPADSSKINILTDPEKYFSISNDTLFLDSPCCDRYNTVLKKEYVNK